MALESPGHDPVVLDLGTGLRFWGEHLPLDGSFRGHALVTHLHWDHVQGLPFFVPVNRAGAQFDIYGPPSEHGMSLADAFGELMRPPYFPVRVGDLAGDFRFHTLDDGDHAIGDAKVRVRQVPHVGATNGYRIEMDGVSVAYIPDHQQPLDGSFDVADSVLDLCDGVDLLIHDAQYTPVEFEAKAHWGHCTVEYAVRVAARSGARRLVLFHHDPDHDDAMMDELLAGARGLDDAEPLREIVAAYEGMTIALSASDVLGA